MVNTIGINMSRVFIVNEPLKTNHGTGEKGRAIDLRPAQLFGELVFLSPAGEPPLDPDGWLPRMRELLSTFKFGEDYLLPVGHPSLIVAAAAILGCFIGSEASLCILVWQGRGAGYVVNRLPLFPPPENQLKDPTPKSQGEYDEKV